jgi:hypothetical protein
LSLGFSTSSKRHKYKSEGSELGIGNIDLYLWFKKKKKKTRISVTCKAPQPRSTQIMGVKDHFSLKEIRASGKVPKHLNQEPSHCSHLTAQG